MTFKLENLCEDEVSVILDFLPGKTLHRLMIIPLFSNSTYYFFHTFVRLTKQRTKAIQTYIDIKTNIQNKKQLKSFIEFEQNVFKKKKKPEESEFWKLQLTISNEKMIQYKSSFFKGKYNINRPMAPHKWRKYILQLKHFEVYDIDKVFPLKRNVPPNNNSFPVSTGIAYCLDSEKRSDHLDFKEVFDNLQFLLKHTTFQIYDEKFHQPYELFLRACLIEEKYEELIEEIKKVHQQKNKFKESPLEVMLRVYQSTNPMFVKLFFENKFDKIYEVIDEDRFETKTKE